jgi:hypothetical protein
MSKAPTWYLRCEGEQDLGGALCGVQDSNPRPRVGAAQEQAGASHAVHQVGGQYTCQCGMQAFWGQSAVQRANIKLYCLTFSSPTTTLVQYTGLLYCNPNRLRCMLAQHY